jgi:hypothetical protein
MVVLRWLLKKGCVLLVTGNTRSSSKLVCYRQNYKLLLLLGVGLRCISCSAFA